MPPFTRRLLLLAAALWCATPLPAAEPAAPRTLRIMTYNIHHGEGTDGKLDLPRIAQLISEAKADIVALQEVDRGVERSQRVDQAQELAKLLDMHYVFGKNIDHQGGDYGNATLSRFAIRQSANHRYQTVLNGEQRGVLETSIDVDGRTLVVLNTHLDYHRDDRERLACVAELKALAAKHGDAALIACGDFNATPDSTTHEQMREMFRDAWQQVGQGPGNTIPSLQPRSRIDYLWSTGAIKPLTARVIESASSDHCALVAEFSW
jgi:endonuclease/exonuclease/phosphatase family metal-dependent hydrolase